MAKEKPKKAAPPKKGVAEEINLFTSVVQMTDADLQQVGQELFESRPGWQTRLAELTGLSPNDINRQLRGLRRITAEQQDKILTGMVDYKISQIREWMERQRPAPTGSLIFCVYKTQEDFEALSDESWSNDFLKAYIARLTAAITSTYGVRCRIVAIDAAGYRKWLKKVKREDHFFNRNSYAYALLEGNA